MKTDETDNLAHQAAEDHPLATQDNSERTIERARANLTGERPDTFMAVLEAVHAANDRAALAERVPAEVQTQLDELLRASGEMSAQGLAPSVDAATELVTAAEGIEQSLRQTRS